ncbi:PREDICTED: protein ROOT PRIMORDIUM DEFECTIVE 1 [Theobroma cacao]|uniref:Protein ROOT PRIMORDIUM DEFECTIVE 1 n=1 Tax=Theobroma cacao TaxID=3641 RepID=A0AB32X022_THECC|nr:PREDICTED: protein ROOT PRIMORDIUM DEFECTIVE 1 [Theobroma cacao]
MKFPTHDVRSRTFCVCRTFMDGAAATIKFVRDRGLDHAVEREKNLRPLLNVKNLIKSEPSKSVPLSIISQHKESLKIPSRPIEFIRKYPSVFREFLPGGIGTGIHPHIMLTPEVLDIDAEEHLVYQSDSYKQLVADSLLKLLMISRTNKIPIRILDILKWDLGLPQNYLKTLVPDFPDYFRLVGSEDSGQLELVCWSDELAVSVLEKKTMKGESGYSKGMPIAFPAKFSKGFEMDKKVKKWWDDWQKLPYVSPYENALHLSPKTDEFDKWVAAVLYEILYLFVGKKAGRDDLLCVGEYLGIRSRFKRVLLHHPHIFYLSSKTGTYTVVLKEAYKRGLLLESNSLMNIRNRYIHLMHTVKENGKDISIPSGSNQEKKATSSAPTKEEGGGDDDESEEENNWVSADLSVSEIEDGDFNDEEGGYERNQRGARETVAVSRRRTNKRKNVDLKAHSSDGQGERAMGKYHGVTRTKIPPNGSRNVHPKSQRRSPNLHQRSRKSLPE